MSTTTRTPEVWDLSDDTAHGGRDTHPQHVAVLDRRGPLSAVLGTLAVACAVLPGLPATGRWCLVIGLGVAAMLVGLGALRRRQILLTVLLAGAGVAMAVVAGVLVAVGSPPRPLVESVVLQDGAPSSTDQAVTATPQLASRPAAERSAARSTATRLALHLRAMHGAAGPFPATLGSVLRTVVERGGAIDGVQVGPVPEGLHVLYSVAPDQRFFEVRVELDDDHDAAVTADSTIEPPTAG